MEALPFIILLVIGVPVALVIWLMVRAVSARRQIEDLSHHVNVLHQEVIRLKESVKTPAAPCEPDKTFKPATLPSRKSEPVEGMRPPPPPQPETTLPQPPVVAPPPIIAPPPFIPPLPPETVPASEPMPRPEPVLEAAAAPIATESENSAAPEPEKPSFEMRLGTFWLVRIGIVMLLTGLAFFGNYAYHNIIGKLGAGGKISLLYLASGLLLGAGAWWQRRNVKESLQNYAQVLFAGGLAAVYFTTYAAHHIPPLRVIGNAA